MFDPKASRVGRQPSDDKSKPADTTEAKSLSKSALRTSALNSNAAPCSIRSLEGRVSALTEKEFLYRENAVSRLTLLVGEKSDSGAAI